MYLDPTTLIPPHDHHIRGGYPYVKRKQVISRIVASLQKHPEHVCKYKIRQVAGLCTYFRLR
jgi:hypothetical protein